MTAEKSRVPRRDPRYQKADEAIRAAFLKLFEEREVDEITASEIIAAAGVNRSTFYAHYPDKYALLDAVEEDFLQQAEDIFRKSPTMGLLLGRESDARVWEAYFGGLVDLLQANQRLVAGLVNRKGGSFMTRFSSSFAEVLKESDVVSKLGIPVNYQASLLAWATAGLVEEWARGGFADEHDRVVSILVQVATGIQSAVLE